MNDPFAKQNPNSEAETTGTTIMALIYDGGVLLGADSRTTSG